MVFVEEEEEASTDSVIFGHKYWTARKTSDFFDSWSRYKCRNQNRVQDFLKYFYRTEVSQKVLKAFKKKFHSVFKLFNKENVIIHTLLRTVAFQFFLF